ncbi:MAG: hypothetical protein AAF383_24270 [Cyanobacteria bacterium P01_A01_bin.83]
MSHKKNNLEYINLFRNTPHQFKVISIQPELIVQHKKNLGDKMMSTIFVLPFAIIFIGHCFILICGLAAILTLNFRNFFYFISYGKNNFLYVLVFIFTFLLLGTLGSTLLASLFREGRKLSATSQSLTIIDRSLLAKKFDREVSISSENIDCFKRFHLSDGMSGDSWKIKVITNQALYDQNVSFPNWFPQGWITQDLLDKINYQIEIFSFSNPRSVDWLGKVLAEFYDVEYIFYQ